MKLLYYLVLIVSLLLSLSLIAMGAVYMHEKAHAEINSRFGCLNSTIDLYVSPFSVSGSTYCSNWSKYATIEDIEKAKILNLENEIIFYNTAPLLLGIITMLAVIVLVIKSSWN